VEHILSALRDIEVEAGREGRLDLAPSAHDPDTGLPNRVLFEDRLDRATRRADRSRNRFALAFISLDGLREVCSRHGHRAGTELLVAMGARLEDAVRATDTVVHLREDEFAVLFEDLEPQADVHQLSAKVASVVQARYALRDTRTGSPVEVAPRVSMGVAVYPEHGRSRQEILGRADSLMHKARISGGGVRVHTVAPKPSGAPAAAEPLAIPAAA
jgi:diguanylate cyclase (GGDEF)-like protein